MERIVCIQLDFNIDMPVEKKFLFNQKTLAHLCDNILVKNNILWISRARYKMGYIDLRIPSLSY